MLSKIAGGIALALDAIEVWRRVAKSLGHSDQDLEAAVAAARRERAVQVATDRADELSGFRDE